MHIGEAIRAIRIGQGRTQESVALDVGFNSANLSRLERGEQAVTLDRLMVLAAVLKTKASDIVRMIEGPTAIGGTSLQEEEAAYPDDMQALCRAYSTLDTQHRMIGLMMIRDLAKAQRAVR